MINFLCGFIGRNDIMKLIFAKSFIRDYQKLPLDIQQLLDKQLEFLLSNPLSTPLCI